MTDQPVDPDPHADKYDDPRVRISTLAWVIFAVCLTSVAILLAVISLYARRTQLERTTEFWGEQRITALQLADRVSLLPGRGQSFEAVNLTAMPGLGHLRRALLDERHYRWETVTPKPVSERCEQGDAVCVRLRFADPTGRRVPVTEIEVELTEGWVGPADEEKRVRVTERVQPALEHQLETLMSVSQLRAENRRDSD